MRRARRSRVEELNNTLQLQVFCHITGFTSEFLRFIVVEHISRKRPQIYALWMTISGGRTEQHVIMDFGELAAVD